MRWQWLVIVCAGCTSATSSKYGHLIDEPFLRASDPPAASTTVVQVGGAARLGPATAQGELSVEVPLPSATPPTFYGISLSSANDLVFVLDRSGSMFGPKLWQAKDELVHALDRLPDGTRYNVVFFGDRITPLADRAVTLDAESRRQTRQFLGHINVENMTAMVPALWLAARMHPKRVVLLTDGEANAMGGPDDVLAFGRGMIRDGVRFDVVVLRRTDRCIDQTGNTKVRFFSAGQTEACRAEKAAQIVHTLSTESGGTYSEPLSAP